MENESGSIFKDNYIPTCQVLPLTIEFLIKNRNSIEVDQHLGSERRKTLLAGMNYSIVLNTACLVEGHLDLFLKIATKIVFKDIEDEMVIQEKRILVDFMKRCNRTSWKSYRDLFPILLGKKLSKPFEDDVPITIVNVWDQLWKDMSYLFNLRNILAHGISIGMNYGLQDNEDEFDTSVQTIQKYYKERNIGFGTFLQGDLYLKNILTKSVANHFYKKSKEFLLILAEHVKIDGTIVLKKEILEKIFEQK